MKSGREGVWVESPKGLTIHVRVCPSTRREKSPLIVDVGEGCSALQIAVREAPVDGKANKAVIEKIAQIFNVPKAAITIKSGEASRLKRVFIEGDTQQLISLIEQLV
ncbi:MAG: DUF167 domain-containing protein [Proteobacteria bacterium]|jgi:uncharacterized protein (TIGR00251 family)|nr:DUF167 domain-containing protein [Alphaproteobacteria bacterium]NCC03519.1 DUF167 domain-containing protein [Pseudomonadota bacterium]